MREYRGERDRHSGAVGYDLGQAADRSSVEHPPERAAVERLAGLRQATESAATRTQGLSTIVQRHEWRAERATLTEVHATLTRQLEQQAADAAMSKEAQQQHAIAADQLRAMAAVLSSCKEPRANPPVPGEEAIEPRIVDRSAVADDVLAWVAGLGNRERRALAERVHHVQGSAAREDGFAVALANYIAGKRMMSQFLGVVENPRRFNRGAYENARGAAANGVAERDAVSSAVSTTLGARGDGNDMDSASPISARRGAGRPLPYRAEMERSFGRSFSEVEAHTGMAARAGHQRTRLFGRL